MIQSAGGRPDSPVAAPRDPAIIKISLRTGWIVLTTLGLSLSGSGTEAPAQTSTATEKQSAVSVPPLLTEFVYEAVVAIDAPIDVGATPLGRRRYIPITGGTLQGPRLRGVVLPGGADWQTDRSDGVTEADALYSIRTDDGTVIIVRNQGVIAAGGAYMRTALRFTAPNGPHEWLNQSQFVSSIAGGPRPGTVIIRVFRVL